MACTHMASGSAVAETVTVTASPARCTAPVSRWQGVGVLMVPRTTAPPAAPSAPAACSLPTELTAVPGTSSTVTCWAPCAGAAAGVPALSAPPDADCEGGVHPTRIGSTKAAASMDRIARHPL